MSKFLIACGGTGGHLAPGIALAETMLERGHDVRLFISRKKVDTRLVEKYPQLTTTRVPGLPFGWRPDVMARFVIEQGRGLKFSLSYLRNFRPDAVIGFGGFTNAGVTLAARLLNIPIALHEANRVPGRAIRVLSRVAQRLYLPPGVRLPGRLGLRVRHTGLPVRREVACLPREAARELLGVNPLQKLLVIMGGSQGSSPLNKWVAENVAALAAEGVQTWCVTGLGKGENEVREFRSKSGAKVGAWFEPFTDRVGALLSAADLVVSRAGAGTLAELVRCETPAILIPYPEAADNHQWANARQFEQQGGGLVIDQNSLSLLRQEVLEVLFNEWLVHKFRENLHRMATEDAVNTMAQDLEELALRIPPQRHVRHRPVTASTP
ncbi:MAG: UDP-N-acetylglucosamine--N-acetylmuramyl-(pentapeptide) pyrophosphoryl-undecaprenol N-acetylglucosamine transferase [Candidatus Didemnitutus sp.]|nr:UDP-N-acetylglucosamine--N-acetylmuramyl-(pentapeptide) pyrophosphoryl-undecaprenol N-acetylglucosamine transferase [Candidatus Didemnitutus sp.]